MKVLLQRVKNVANDRITRVLFYDQTLKKGYASLASFSKLFILRRVLVTLAAYPLSLCCWVLLVVLNRFMPVRIFRFKQPQRPGLVSVYIEQLEPLCRELQATGNKGILIFIDASETTNLELLKLYATHFNLYLDDRVAFVRTIFALVPKIGFLNTHPEHTIYNKNWELPSAITVGTKRKTEVPKMISQLEIKPFEYVILTHRSLLYDKRHKPTVHLNFNRYTDISKAESAIKLINENGLKVVRMGIDTEALPDTLKDLSIIDLSGRFRTDKQDLWLSEYCRFLWGINNTGSWHVPHKYNRPTLITNSYVVVKGYQHSLFTLQLIWDESKNRNLSMSEMFTLKGVVGKSEQMKARGLTFVDNSPTELSSSVSDMLNYSGNKIEYSEHDLALISRFNELLINAGFQPMTKGHSQPCVSFLRDHSELLL